MRQRAGSYLLGEPDSDGRGDLLRLLSRRSPADNGVKVALQPLLPKMTLTLEDRVRRAALGTCSLACTHTHCRLMSSCWVKTEMFLKKPVWQLESRGGCHCRKKPEAPGRETLTLEGAPLARIWGKRVGLADGGEESSRPWADVSVGPCARSGTESRTPPPSPPMTHGQGQAQRLCPGGYCPPPACPLCCVFLTSDRKRKELVFQIRGQKKRSPPTNRPRALEQVLNRSPSCLKVCAGCRGPEMSSAHLPQDQRKV